MQAGTGRAQTAPGAEVHFHALFGVDDGPATLADAVALLSAAAAEGTRDVAVTPHVRAGFVTEPLALAPVFAELAAAVARAGLPLRLHPGAEVGHDMVGRLSPAELEACALGPAGARFVLLETPWDGLGAHARAAASKLRARGYRVVLAHPERSARLWEDHGEDLRAELAAGTRLQVNASSLTGAHGPEVRAAALDLLRAGVVTAIASDAHGPKRPPLLHAAVAAAAVEGLPPAALARLVGPAPRALLCGPTTAAHGFRRRPAERARPRARRAVT